MGGGHFAQRDAYDGGAGQGGHRRPRRIDHVGEFAIAGDDEIHGLCAFRAFGMACAFHARQPGLQGVLRQHIVRVREGHVFPARQLKARVPRRSHAAVFAMHHANAPIRSREPVAQLRRAVGAAIIHQDEFPPGEGLGADAADTHGKERLRVVHGDDDAHHGSRLRALLRFHPCINLSVEP